MRKHLCVRGWFLVVCSMLLCLASIIISSRMGINTFSRSAPLSSLMIIMEHVSRFIIILLIIFIVLSPRFLCKFFKNNGEKKWKALVPIYNIRVLLGIIGIETKFFSVVVRGMIIGILALLLIPRYQCACYSYSEFSVSLFVFVMSIYCFGFVISLLYRLHKYNSDKEKLNDKND